MFKLRSASLFVLIVLVIFGSGCSVLQQGGSGGSGESYFPHAQGNSWRMTGSDGSSQAITVEGTSTVGTNSVQCFSSFNKSALNIASTDESYYKVDGTGVYYYGSASYPSSIVLQMFAFPLEVGKTWKVLELGSSTIEGVVVAKENVTVPAGTFDCYKVAISSTYGASTYTSNIWLGNNTGIVKTTNNSSTVESVLAWKNI